jgi:hypothetical protein
MPLRRQVRCYLLYDDDKRHRWTKTNEPDELVQRWHSPGHVLEARFVSLVIRDKVYRRGTLRSLFNETGQILNGNFFVASNVNHFANRAVSGNEPQHCLNDVADVAKAATLLTVPNTVKGTPSRACDTKVGTTIP